MGVFKQVASGEVAGAARGSRREERDAGGAEHPSMSTAVAKAPRTNRGDRITPALATVEEVQLLMCGDEIKVVSVRVPTNGQVAMIDGIRFVISETTFHGAVMNGGVSDDLYIEALSERLEEILGFGITRNLNQRRDFYDQTYELGDNYGHVGFGGKRQNSTMLVALYGAGTLAAKPGWEARMHEFLSTAKAPTITRVDLAHDWFAGEVTVDQFDQMHTDGLFTNSSQTPQCQYAGDWKNPNGKGRTFYVGSRKAGLVFRGYEKGMEQGDESSPWVRGEVEISNKSRFIPLDVLLDPSGYYVGAYRKAFSVLPLKVTPKRVEVKRKTASINIDASLKNIHRQFGKYAFVLAALLGPEEFLRRITNTSGAWPQRLKVPDHELCETPIHRREKTKRYNEFALDATDMGGAVGHVF